MKRPARLFALVASLGVLTACGARATVPAPAGVSGPAAQSVSPAAGQPSPTVADSAAQASASSVADSTGGRTEVYAADVELPPGAGREILLTECLSCHTLGALDLFKAFYRRDDWHSLVLTMVEHGAAVDAAQVEVLSDYLAEHFGPDAP